MAFTIKQNYHEQSRRQDTATGQDDPKRLRPRNAALTKQDKKHIQEQVRKLTFRIVEEAKEYMTLYERTYYEEVIKICKQKIETIDALKELSIKYGKETGT